MKTGLAHGELSDLCCEQNADPKHQRKAITSLLEAGADIQETDKNGVTPLHFAVRFRSPAAVETLLQHGANPNQACKRSGSTPLHRAVTTTGAPATAGKQGEAKEIIKLLLASGADPALKNKNGKTPADYVNDPEVLKLLEARSQRRAH
jgi:tankyrase